MRLPLLALAALLAACAQPQQAVEPAAPPAPAPAATAAPPLPDVPLAPRRAWRQLPDDGVPGTVFAASRPVDNGHGLRRGWIALNLAEPIPLPETGGRARSVAFLADYDCSAHAWHPLQTIWYRRRDGRGEALREQPRGPDGMRHVEDGTLIDAFLDEECKL